MQAFETTRVFIKVKKIFRKFQLKRGVSVEIDLKFEKE
jgi:hypothetical protein